MKKIKNLLVILISTLLVLGTTACYATNTQKNIEFNITQNVKLKKGDKTATIVLSLGDFSGITGNPLVLGYEGTLEYNKDVIKSISVKGLNGWTSQYEDSTKVIIGDVQSAKPNTNISEMTITLADNVPEGTETTIKLNNLMLTDGENDFVYNKEIKITVEKAAVTTPEEDEKEEPTAKPEEEKENKEDITKGEQTKKEDTIKEDKKNGVDQTIAEKKIPQTGVNVVAGISIAVVAVVGVISFIGYKTTKLK